MMLPEPLTWRLFDELESSTISEAVVYGVAPVATPRTTDLALIDRLPEPSTALNIRG